MQSHVVDSVSKDGFPYCEKCIQLASENVKKDSSEWGHELVLWSFYNMFVLYKAAADYETALDYLFKGYKYAEEKKNRMENVCRHKRIVLHHEQTRLCTFILEPLEKKTGTVMPSGIRLMATTFAHRSI